MRTAGVDLASQVGSSAACVIEWPESAKAHIIVLERGVADARILAIASEVDKLGIDVPLGWPRRFARAVERHSRTQRWDPKYDHIKDSPKYRLRDTDRHIARATRTATTAGIIPLSVSTDRIGVPALRAAAMLARLPEPAPLDGSGLVVEAYPAGALLRWGLPYRQYKGASETYRRRRAELIAAFGDATREALELTPDDIAACERTDHLFDALVAACIARAAAIGETKPIPRRFRKAARREGWIAVPRRGALGRLGATRSPEVAPAVATPLRALPTPVEEARSAMGAPSQPVV
jgi:Protein of unknown function (DUF429)